MAADRDRMEMRNGWGCPLVTFEALVMTVFPLNFRSSVKMLSTINHHETFGTSLA